MVKKVFGFIGQYFRKLDKNLFTAVFVLGTFSVVLLYSMSANGLTGNFYRMQGIMLIAGGVAALIISALDYRKFTKLWFLFAPAVIIMCLLVFTPLGYKPQDNANDIAWLDLGFTTVQPSEFLKIAFILTFALHLSHVKDEINRLPNVLLLGIHGAVPLGIIFLQGDDGTLIIFLFMFLSMLFAAGLSLKYIIPAMIAAPAAVWALWNYVLEPHQKNRFIVLWTPPEQMDVTLQTIAYQQERGILALGSGKILGNGFFAERYVYVPYMQNDFIFTYIGQCLGFVGCVAVVAILGYVCLKIIADSRIAKDDLGKNICIGVFAMIFFHAVLNIGMVLFVMPVIGVPLPFLSQGGTSLLSMFVAIGLVMSVYSHSEKVYRVFYDYES
jgi:rod shape determining protein RodA